MNEILFAKSDTLNFTEITPHFHGLLLKLQQILPACDSIQQQYEIWKKIGNRVLDAEYTSSRQQVKKTNPQEEQIQKLFLLECLFALILRSYTAKRKQNMEIFSFNSIKQINTIFGTFQHSNWCFLFENDIFHIWGNQELQQNHSEFDLILSKFLPQTILLLEKIHLEEIFPKLQQMLLANQERKLMGEFYTPQDLAKIMHVKSQKYLLNPLSILDLSCGSGVLLYEWMNSNEKEKNPRPICVGIDISPLAVLMTKFILTIQHEMPASIDEPLIFCADSISSFALQKTDEALPKSNKMTEFNQIHIEFFGKKYSILVQKRADLTIFDFRIWIRTEIQKTREKRKSSIEFPIELWNHLEKHDLKPYLINLLADRITSAEICTRSFDLILGNPPYLRVQAIQPRWKREVFTKIYQSAIGHYDLYYLFIELGIQLLSPHGILVYITSNKFMSTSAGIGIRNQIIDKTSIKEIIDFSDSHVFNALVLPMIFILQQKFNQVPSPELTSPQFSYTYLQKEIHTTGEEHSQRNLFEQISLDTAIEEQIWTLQTNRTIKFGKRTVDSPTKKMKKWSFLSDEVQEILNLIRTQSSSTLEHEAKKIIVGIKTTADYAFIDDFSTQFINTDSMIQERKEIRQKFGIELYPTLIHGKQIRNFQILPLSGNSQEEPHIFYPYTQEQSGKLRLIPEKDLPYILKYMKSKGYYDSLKKREYILDAKKQWYEIWNTKNPQDMAQPYKIVVPDISPKNNFAIDYQQRYLDGNAYYILLKEPSLENYRYMVGILNSYVCEFFHKLTSGNQLYAGRFRYWSTTIKNFPLIPFKLCESKKRSEIVAIVQQLEQYFSPQLENKLNEVIFSIFGIEGQIQKTITEWIKSNRVMR